MNPGPATNRRAFRSAEVRHTLWNTRAMKKTTGILIPLLFQK
jgi:hypothetical protein